MSLPIFKDDNKNLMLLQSSWSAAINPILETSNVYLESLVSTYANTGASAIYFDATSLTLSPGEWDMTGIIFYNRNTSTFTAVDLVAAITTTSGNSPTGINYGINGAEFNPGATNTPTGFGQLTLMVPSYRVKIKKPTTYFLKGFIAIFTVGNPQYTCRLSARKVENF